MEDDVDALTRARRARTVRRHRLAGDATDPLDAVRSVLALHATDPATVHVSVLARCGSASLADVAASLHADDGPVRLMAMRRTLFVVPREDVAVVQAAASRGVAATVRARLVKELSTLPTDPPLSPDPAEVEAWLDEVMAATERVAAEAGPLPGERLGAAEPRLRTAILPTTTKGYDVRRTVTSQVLTLMGLEGRLVRGRPAGSWTSRRHTWRAGSTVPEVAAAADLDGPASRGALVRRYLEVFGPATEVDVAWWTGWAKGVTRAALAAAGAEETPAGWVAPGDDLDTHDEPPAEATLLPALDPTPMGWKERDWFLPEDRRPLYDAYGNVGPTVWWRGEVVGAWAVRRDGSVVTRLLVDRGAECAAAVEVKAARLEPRLEGAAWVPSFPTPAEKELRTA